MTSALALLLMKPVAANFLVTTFRAVEVAMIIAFTFGLIALPFFLEKRAAKKRARELEAILSGHGLVSAPEEKERLFSVVQWVRIGRRGHYREIINPFKLPGSGPGIAYLMDYTYAIGTGKTTAIYNQTLLLLHRDNLALPEFVLAPEGFFKRIGQLFGAQDFDFEEHPVFSQLFQLQGWDEAAVRALFNSAVITALEQRPGFSIEGREGYLVVYRGNKRPKPREMPRFIEEAGEVAGLFLKSC